ncbi:uncharacterized protein [Chelonus insularis]|uniref:uncharacterized protein n=1 Tax=Chelonus insularis TaxID=460826 RepID=UPI00158EFD50|nr:uncharacterized protein LOC118071079 [Chelonus insularis]
MKQGLTILTKVPLTSEFIPIRHVLFRFFELPCVLNDTLKYIKSLEKREIIHNYFELALILGDNLGLHELFGLVESFSANYFCRFCLINKNDINKVFNEELCNFQNKDNYYNGLLVNNVAATGIKERCFFHELSEFHFTENLSADVMHDF